MTERDFEVEGQTLIIKSDGRVMRAPVPPEMDPKMFRHITAAVDMLYRRDGVIPTADAVLKSWEGFPRKAVELAMGSEELKDALALRGIEWDSKRGLTSLQLNALLILQDFTDARSTSAKLKTIGVTMPQYRAWMRNPLFAQQMAKESEHNLADSVGMALNRLVGNAEAGDQRAIEKLLEISGRYNPQAQELQNAQQVLQIFLEALERHASPEVLRSVHEDVQKKTRSLVIMQAIKE